MIRVVLIGDVERAEMRPIAGWLAERTAKGSLKKLSVIAPRSASELGRADLIVVLESHPDEYSSEDVNALFAAAPLGRIVCCAGSWSESARRTRKLWPLAVRVPAIYAIARLEHEWELLENHTAAQYLPATGSREEWFATQHPPVEFAATAKRQAIGIVSPDPAYRDMLADLVAAAGHTVIFDSTTVVDVVLYDVDPCDACRKDDVRQRAKSATVIALTDWPLPEMVVELKASGISSVLPKLGDHNRILKTLSAPFASLR